jgi:hypothetical protein
VKLLPENMLIGSRGFKKQVARLWRREMAVGLYNTVYWDCQLRQG